MGNLLSRHARAVNDETHSLASLIEVAGLLIEIVLTERLLKT